MEFNDAVSYASLAISTLTTFVVRPWDRERKELRDRAEKLETRVRELERAQTRIDTMIIQIAADVAEIKRRVSQ